MTVVERPASPILNGQSLMERLISIREPLPIVYDSVANRIGVPRRDHDAEALELRGTLPPLFPEWLGDRAFLAAHGTRFPYVVGEMARGITSEAMVIAAARYDILAFFGSAGLTLERVRTALARFAKELDPRHASYGINLIHSPNDPALEAALVDLYLEQNVARVSASAFLGLTPNVVRYACTGLRRGPDGLAIRAGRLLAKISRPETARHFMSPPPAAMLDALVSAGHLTRDEAAIAATIPLAEDITAEADSGGHTDNRTLTTLLPTLMILRDELAPTYGEPVAVRVGAAGGLGTPAAIAAAFATGAAYVVTGSVNQAAIESGLGARGRAMLAEAGIADTTMAACADMFELGVKVQVLRRGSLFPMRANKLYELYRTHDSLYAIPPAVREQLEQTIFHASLDAVWAETASHFAANDPAELARAERDAKHKMALVFRWYLGLSSRWPITDEAERKTDYQIWCGPAMGAFNAWAAGTFLAESDRTVVEIALNLLEGAAVATRAQQARSFGVDVPAVAFNLPPRRMT